MKQARRHQLEEMNGFRKSNQQPYQRRDYDLYDPQSLKNGLPARIGDEDPRCGVSTLQQFDGEDLGNQIPSDAYRILSARCLSKATNESLGPSANLRKRAYQGRAPS